MKLHLLQKPDYEPERQAHYILTKIGDMGVVTDQHSVHFGSIILRVFDDRFVSLDNPGATWIGRLRLLVKKIPPGTQIFAIVTEGEADDS